MTEKTKMPKVSVIIPCYNVPEELISRVLASLQAQTFRDFELIIVDDGSEESFASSLEALCRETENACFIRIPNAGVSEARNTGLAHAGGEYITFVDADDFVSPDFLERAWAIREESNAEIVIGGTFYTADADGYAFPERNGTPKYRVYEGKEVHEIRYRMMGPDCQIRFPGGIVNRGPVARLVKTALAREFHFDSSVRIAEDMVWNLQILDLCQKLCIASEVWYCYWQNPYSTTHRFSQSYVDDCRVHLERISSLIDWDDEREYYSYVNRIFEQLRMIWLFFLRFEKQKDRMSYRKAVHTLYTEHPWIEAGAARYRRLAKGQKKFASALYRLHCYFFFITLRERFRKEKA